MKITLKNTILASSALAVGLNFCQLASGYAQRKDAYTSPLVFTTPSPRPAVAQAKLPASPTSLPATVNDPVSKAVAALSRAGLDPAFAQLYVAAEQTTGTPWELIAAVHHYETNQAGDTARTSSAGAVGPMQFMPATFRSYALDGDADGTKTITDVDDAVYSAGRYLAAGGAADGQYSTALYRYNHSSTYVSRVKALAVKLGI